MSNIDILVTHMMPKGYGDAGRGCEELLECVTKEIKPKYHLFGHVHRPRKKVSYDEKNNIVFVNSSVLSNTFAMCDHPTVIDVELSG